MSRTHPPAARGGLQPHNESDAGYTSEPLPDEVRALLRERIESYEALEILIALERVRGIGKTAGELSAGLHVTPALVDRAVRNLEAAGLVERRSAVQPQYFYAPPSAELDCAVRALARAYAEQPIPVIKLMSENAIQRMRTGAARAFADAFILRRGKGDG